MNYSKLLKINLAKPIGQRRHISPCDIQDTIIALNMAANYRALRANIETEIAPKLGAMRHAQDIMDRIGAVSGAMPDCHIARKATRDNGEYITPYSFHPGSGIEPSLAGSNDSFASVYQAASNQAFDHTQTTSGGLHAND